MKKFVALFLVILCLIPTFTGCGLVGEIFNSMSKQDEIDFYNLVYENQAYLDELADDIYSCWYDYVYEDKYSGPDEAIDEAFAMNEHNIETIIENNSRIRELYKDIKDGELEEEVKDVMYAYNEYYSFIIEVSGSFETFSESKEPLKKNLSSALKNLSFEI